MLQTQVQDHAITVKDENLKHGSDRRWQQPDTGPWSSSKEPEKPMEAHRGDASVREESEEPWYLWNNFLKGRSCGKMFLKSGLTKSEDGRAEPRMENEETKMQR